MDLNRHCTLCELCEKSPKVCIPGDGGDSAKIFIVMESPSAKEARSSRLLQGEAGQMLLTMLENRGFSRKNLYISNAIKCVVPFGQKVKASHLKACAPYVKQEIEQISPDWILLCGASPLKLIKKTGITDYHGNPQVVEGRNYFPMMSPGIVSRDPSKKAIIEQAVDKLCQLVRGEYEEPEEINWQVVTKKNEEEFLWAWSESEEISFDVETTGLLQQDPTFRVNSIAFTFSNLTSWGLPLYKNEDRKWARALLIKLSHHTEGKEFIAHNGKFDNNSIFARYGFRFPLHFDTMLASHLLDENSPNGLKFLAQIYCGAEDYDDLTLKEKTGHMPPDKLKKLYRYNCLDTYYTLLLKRLFKMKLRKSRSLNRLFKRLVMPAAQAFEVIDYRGHYIRMDALEKATQEAQEKIVDLERQMNQYRPSRKIINWGSPAQVSKFLFDHLKLPITQYTPDHKPSTGEAALIDLKDEHPIINLLLEWRGTQKHLNTYLLGYREFMVEQMLYISTKLHGTVTGRFSSRLHQTPRDGTVRNIYGAPPGYLFVCADFSQIELRLVAEVSGDPTLRHIFQTGGDVHVETAKEAMGLTDEPTKEQRKAAKCFHPDTEVLTKVGWKRIMSLCPGEQIIQALPQDGGEVKLEWAVPTEVFTQQNNYDYLVELKTEGINLRVTPDHRMLALRQTGKWYVTDPEDFRNCRYFASAGQLKGGKRELDEVLLRLAVATQADGSYTGKKIIRFGFKKDRKIRRLTHLLELSGIPFRYKPGIVSTFTIYDGTPIKDILDTEKRFPWGLLELTPELREVVLDEIQYWDSHIRENWRMVRYTSHQTQNLEVIQSLCALSGRKSRVSGFHLSIKDHHKSRGRGNLKPRRVSYSGEVSCLSVDSSYVLVRDRGVPVIVGQSINFGFIYGMAWRKFRKYSKEKYSVEITDQESQQFRSRFFSKYYGLEPWHQRVRRRVSEEGFIRYLSGRCRRLPGVFSTEESVRAEAMRQAINSPIQGFGSGDLKVMALVELFEEFENSGNRDFLITGEVHDSILGWVKEDKALEIGRRIKEIMEHPKLLDIFGIELSVPLVADVEIGRFWGDDQIKL